MEAAAVTLVKGSRIGIFGKIQRNSLCHFLPGPPKTSHLSDLFRQFPRGVASLMDYTDAVLRDDAELSKAERELIATYVSSLNACEICFGAHKIYTEAFGIDEAVIEALINDINSVEGLDKLKPVLHYLKKLNFLPSKITRADAHAVYDAGWTEEALYEATQVCALFNMMNRLIEGAGVNFDMQHIPKCTPWRGPIPMSKITPTEITAAALLRRLTNN